MRYIIQTDYDNELFNVLDIDSEEIICSTNTLRNAELVRDIFNMEVTQ